MSEPRIWQYDPREEWCIDDDKVDGKTCWWIERLWPYDDGWACQPIAKCYLEAEANLMCEAPVMAELLARMLRGDEKAYYEAQELLESVGYDEAG